MQFEMLFLCMFGLLSCLLPIAYCINKKLRMYNMYRKNTKTNNIVTND